MAPKPKRELKNYALVSGKDASKSGKSRLWTSVVKTSEIKDGKVKGHPCKIRKIATKRMLDKMESSTEWELLGSDAEVTPDNARSKSYSGSIEKSASNHLVYEHDPETATGSNIKAICCQYESDPEASPAATVVEDTDNEDQELEELSLTPPLLPSPVKSDYEVELFGSHEEEESIEVSNLDTEKKPCSCGIVLLRTIVPILNDIKVQIETIQNSGGSSSSSGRDLISLQQCDTLGELEMLLSINQESLLKTFMSFGGRTAGNMIRSCLSRVASDQVWSYYSLYGRKGNFGLLKTNIYEALSGAVLQTFTQSTQAEVDRLCMGFLKHTNTRLKRKDTPRTPDHAGDADNINDDGH